MINEKLRVSVSCVWGCWMFGFGTPTYALWVLAFGPVRIRFWLAGEA